MPLGLKSSPKFRIFVSIFSEMSSLATAAAATRTMDVTDTVEVRNNATYANNSPVSKTSNQDMETDGSEELGKHLESFINDVDTEEEKQNEEISFGGDHTFFRPPSFA